MNKFSHIFEDLASTTAGFSDFVGTFLYAPFGIDSPDALNTFTASFVVGSLCYLTIRQRRALAGALRDRQANEFGLLRPRRTQGRR